MLIRLSDLKDYQVQALDGDVGRVDDVYFYRGEWQIRYLLLAASYEPTDRRVMVPTSNVKEIRPDQHVLILDLTSSQVRESPDVGISQPVSRQDEIELHQYYGWPVDWLEEQHEVMPLEESSDQSQEDETRDAEGEEEVELQSGSEIIGLFQVRSNDAEIGEVTECIIDDDDWTLQFIGAKLTGSPESNILLTTDIIDQVDWVDADIYVDATREVVAASPAIDPSAPLDDEQRARLQAYYS